MWRPCSDTVAAVTIHFTTKVPQKSKSSSVYDPASLLLRASLKDYEWHTTEEIFALPGQLLHSSQQPSYGQAR